MRRPTITAPTVVRAMNTISEGLTCWRNAEYDLQESGAKMVTPTSVPMAKMPRR